MNEWFAIAYEIRCHRIDDLEEWLYAYSQIEGMEKRCEEIRHDIAILNAELDFLKNFF